MYIDESQSKINMFSPSYQHSNSVGTLSLPRKLFSFTSGLPYHKESIFSLALSLSEPNLYDGKVESPQ